MSSGPETGGAKEPRYITKVLGSISLADNKAELELVNIKDEDAPLGVRTALRIRSGSTELSVSPDAALRISGSEIIAVERETIPREDPGENLEPGIHH